jgi:ADP-ribosylglycohydrolase
LHTADHRSIPAMSYESRVRGLLLGIALGESLGRARGALTDTSMIRGGVATQLAAFTAEGLIRAQVRGHHKGTCHPASVLWHAYLRWAVGQNIGDVLATNPWDNYSHNDWPDGWLGQVPALQERRGSAPTTVAALAGGRPGTADQPASNSAGAHGLIRVLPAAALTAILDPDQLTQQVEEYVSLTHGADEARWASTGAVIIAAQSLTTGQDPASALQETGLAEMGTYIDRARWEAHTTPRDMRTLARIAPRPTCENALSAAVYVTNSYPGPDSVMDALHFAAAAPHGASAAAVTGAFLGAAHGADAWPVHLVARHELVWPLDTLGRDLARQLTDNPVGTEYSPPTDANWSIRYPGY